MRRLTGLALVALVAACQALPGGGPVLLLRNETTIPVAIHVDGTWVGTYPAGAIAEVPLGMYGEPPVRIEARSPSGAVLVGLTAGADNLDGTSGVGAAGALPCGYIELAVGPGERQGPQPDVQPSGPCP